MMLSDNVLMAYADGQLDAGERAQVKKLIAQDTALSSRLEIFSSTGHGLASMFDEHMNSPLPAKLSRLSLYAQPRAAKRPGLVQFADALRNFVRPAHPFGLAAASAAMLFAGIGAGWLLLQDGASEGGTPMSRLVQVENNGSVARGALRVALEVLPSGKNDAAAGGAPRIAVKLSFRDQAQDYCRQFEIGLTASETYGGIACKSNGQWNIRYQAQLGTAHPASGKTIPAGGQGSAVEERVISMMDGDALGHQEEDAVIRKGWKAH